MVHHYARDAAKIMYDTKAVYDCIKDCFKGKWTRRDIVSYISSFLPSYSDKEVLALINNPMRDMLLKPTLYTIADSIIWKIKNRQLSVPPIKYVKRFDGNSGKLREIGIQSIEHQILDHIAVVAGWEIWSHRIQPYQCASIQGRGQVYGKELLEIRMRKHPETARYGAKGDIHKCYPSINKDILKAKLWKDTDNEDLLYLLFFLIDTFKSGLSIGSYLSQFLCNYFLSFAYNYLYESYSGYFSMVLFYMDDFIILGADKELVIEAMKGLIEYLEGPLGLEVKSNWEIFPIDWMELDKNGKVKRHGRPIDMMGYVIYRDHTEVRAGIFLRARRTYLKAYLQYAQFNKQIPIGLAHRCISYYGWFKNSDSKWFIREYNVKKIVNMSKAVMSRYGLECEY